MTSEIHPNPEIVLFLLLQYYVISIYVFQKQEEHLFIYH